MVGMAVGEPVSVGVGLGGRALAVGVAVTGSGVALAALARTTRGATHTARSPVETPAESTVKMNFTF